jgi:hypothetical protein
MGRIDTVVSPITPQFSTWNPGEVKPIGTTDPGETNVGPRYPNLTTIYADIALGNNEVLEGVDLYGKLTFTGSNARVRDCIIRGKAWGQGPTWVPGTPTNDAALNATYNGRGAIIEWCRIDMTGRENVWSDGVRGNNFTMKYSEITKTNDGFGAIAGAKYGDTLMENCRIHNGNYFGWWNSAAGTVYPNFPTSPSDRRSHNDCVQIQGWSGYTFRGNYIGGARAALGSNGSGVKQLNRDYLIPAQAAVIAQVAAADDYNNATFMIQNNASAAATVGALIELNWLTGGDATVNLYSVNAYGDTLGGVIVRNNRFIRQSTFPASDGYDGIQIYKKAGCTAITTGNVWDDDDTPVTITSY